MGLPEDGGAVAPGLHETLQRITADPVLAGRIGYIDEAELQRRLKLCKDGGRCVFCDESGFIQVDGCEVIICYRCFQVIYAHIDKFRTFLGCHEEEQKES